MGQQSLSTVLILLATALFVVVLFRRINLPAILGYLLVGIVIGPFAFGLVPDTQGTAHLAEFGVVFLMFSIGLEFSLPQLGAMRKSVFGFGGAQVGLTILLTLGVALLAGQTWQTGLIIGGVLSMSSTAIISKALTDTSALHSPHGKQIMGAALFQDIAVVPLLVMVPALALPTDQLFSAMGIALLKASVVLAIILYFGKILMTPLFNLVARQKSSELFVLAVLFVTLGMAWITAAAGLSLALGAFVAGMLISETQYRYQVDNDIRPFRDVLLGLFFITIGMLLDVGILLNKWVLVLIVLLAFLTLKFFLIVGLSMWLRHDRAVSLRCGLALAPAGEFGFVLLSLAGQLKSVPESTMQIVLAAMLISMLLSPVILKYSDRIVMYFVASEWEQRSVELQQLAMRTMMVKKHVIICGYGRSGQSVARFLRQEKVTVIALDTDPQRVKQASAGGDAVMFGDASKREVLTAAGLPRAAAVVISFADTHAAMTILTHIKQLRPDVPVIVRTFDDTDIDKLKDAGAAEIVAEVVESALMLATQTMLRLGVPVKTVLSHLRDARGERYEIMRGFFKGATDSDDPTQTQHDAQLKSFVIDAGATAVGKTFEALALDKLDVTLNALRRKGVRQSTPDLQSRVEAGDILVLYGAPHALAKAEAMLLQG
jgi:monovalent cation:H+ antiporter-2, CPA2 family